MARLPIALLILAICVISSSIAIKLDVFSKKTIYEWSHKDKVNQMPPPNLYDSITYKQAQCEAVHVSAVFRHGTRNPSDGSMEEIDDLYEKLLENKNATKFIDLENIRKNNLYDIAEETKLISVGISELSGLGERFSLMFNRLFATNRFQFVSSRKDRCKDSSRAFYDGITKQIQNVSDYTNTVNDATMRFYDGCYNYEHGVEENKTTFIHFDKYENTSDFQNVLKSVKSKLGLEIPLSKDELYTMFDMCAYEMYIHNSTRWCDMMTDADRETLEYGEDIKEYYETSYGTTFNTILACPLVEDIFRTMDSVRDSVHHVGSGGKFNYTQDFVAGKFQFGHSATIVALFTALGLFNESSPLLETNRVAMANRKFKTSKIVPFAGNIALALYVCNDVNSTAVTRMFVNEEEVVNPACGQMMCPYVQVKEFYANVINCDRKQVCGEEPDDDDSGSTSMAASLLMLVTTVLISASIYRQQ